MPWFSDESDSDRHIHRDPKPRLRKRSREELDAIRCMGMRQLYEGGFADPGGRVARLTLEDIGKIYRVSTDTVRRDIHYAHRIMEAIADASQA